MYAVATSIIFTPRTNFVHLSLQGSQLFFAGAQFSPDPACPYHCSLSRRVQRGDLDPLSFKGSLLVGKHQHGIVLERGRRFGVGGGVIEALVGKVWVRRMARVAVDVSVCLR